ncbi:hypothetical protein PTSG_12457 [Salpingoeca rosetta]|uniref:HMG box domain-containing protein n=1 Tax=Salpingoeca rosetta (strain ATCC 50818 / BSB-021) TaxID=946362 RepID=F2UG80_SALR5|nr:uncharacterized protein PTSG_12457 [Salpingoeca rosetta]EGD75508.1 hypothetical protein PTSG_12457 [Salpingoeca rosetta]|eukprot:XP_004991965.1 hypothetical protein PTSG_12457 [Salpingoeca rosetta]
MSQLPSLGCHTTARQQFTQQQQQQMLQQQRAAAAAASNPKSSSSSPKSSSSSKPSSSSRRKKKACAKDKDKIKRPLNEFFLYKRDKTQELKRTKAQLKMNTLNAEIGHLWQNESQEVRDHYKRLAEKQKEEHKRLYPDYKFQPRRQTAKPKSSASSSPPPSPRPTSRAPAKSSDAATVP